ncbi:hypothetical protein AgCh_028307 [Apium graveolens]
MVEAYERRKYLGLPCILERSKASLLGYLRDKVTEKCNSWDGRWILRGGKGILVKSVAQTLPSYAMSVFLLPLKITRDIERTLAKYWSSSSSGKRLVEDKVYWSLENSALYSVKSAYRLMLEQKEEEVKEDHFVVEDNEEERCKVKILTHIKEEEKELVGVSMEEEEDVEEKDESMLLVSNVQEESLDDVWYIDSGCSNHMTGNKNCFVNFDESVQREVRTGNNNRLVIKGCGDVPIQTKQGTNYISSVHYVPDLKHNLLSVGNF